MTNENIMNILKDNSIEKDQKRISEHRMNSVLRMSKKRGIKNNLRKKLENKLIIECLNIIKETNIVMKSKKNKIKKNLYYISIY